MVCSPKEGGQGVLDLKTQKCPYIVQYNGHSLGLKHYSNDNLISSQTKKGLPVADILKLIGKYKGMASMLISYGKSCFLREDLWGIGVPRLLYHELHSYAKKKAHFSGKGLLL